MTIRLIHPSFPGASFQKYRFDNGKSITPAWTYPVKTIFPPFPAGFLHGRAIFLFPASRPFPPAPCQINHGSPSIEQSCHKPDRCTTVPSPCGAYITAGHFPIPSRHAAQRTFTMRHGNRSCQGIHPARANCQSHEGGRQQQAGQNSPYRQPDFPDHPAITA